jgi:hypothetical protein
MKIGLLGLVASLGLVAQAGTSYKVGLYGDHFSLTDSVQKVVDRYPLEDPLAAKPKVLAFRRDKVFVVWDARGLTINSGGKVFTTQLKEIPVSPRWRKHEEIVSVLDHKWATAASACSGGRRVGPNVYLVARWQHGPGSTWLEALVRVNVTVAEPRPEVAAIVTGGFSFSAAPIEDNLTVSGQSLVLPVHSSAQTGSPQGGEWGIWSYSPDSGLSKYTKIGTTAKYVRALADGSVGYIEKANDKFVAGTANPSTGEKSDLLDSEQPLRFVDLAVPPLVRAQGDDGEVLHWLDEGKRMEIPMGSQVRRGQIGLIVWTGKTKPAQWTVYGLNSGQPLASSSANPGPLERRTPAVGGAAPL